MPNFFSQLFSRNSSSSKRSKYRGSQTSVNEDSSRRSAATSSSSAVNMRGAVSEENLSMYRVNKKQLEKNKLHKASYQGDLDKVSRLAQPNVIDRPDQQRRTALHYAIDQGNIDIVQHLVHEGAKLNIPDEQKRTPLIKAVITGPSNPQVSQQICHILLSEGANQFINAIDAYGKNALHYAVMMSNEPLVSMLLQCPQCDPNLPDREGMTPLHLAAHQNSPSLTYALLTEPAEITTNPNMPNREGHTPLHLAAGSGFTDVIRVLLQSSTDHPCDPNILDARRMTPAQLARAYQKEDCALLIDSYARAYKNQNPTPPSASISNVQDRAPMKSAMNNPSARLDEEDDDDSSSKSSDDSSTASSGQIQISTGQRTPQYDQPSNSGRGNEPNSIASLFKSNPVQPAMPTTTSSTVAPPPRTGYQTTALGALMGEIPLRPTEPTSFTQTSLGGSSASPKIPPHRSANDRTPHSTSFQESLVLGNPLLNPNQHTGQKHAMTISALVETHSHHQRSESISPSWSQDDNPIVSAHDKSIKPAQKIETWSSSSSDRSHSDDDSGSGSQQMRSVPPPPTVFQQNQPPSALNGTSMFTPSHVQPDPMVTSKSDDDQDEDSIEDAVKKMTQYDPSRGLKTLVNPSIGQAVQHTEFIPSPRGDDSSWSTSSITANHGPANAGIFSMVQNQPLLSRGPLDTNLDDSRPLSADLKKTPTQQKSSKVFSGSSASSTVSNESDDDRNDEKKISILRNSGVAGLVSASIRPPVNETHANGITNLLNIVQTIRHHPQTNQKPTTTATVAPPPTQTSATKNQHGIERSIISPLLQRNDSIQSSNSNSMVDDTVRYQIESKIKANTKQIYKIDDEDDDDDNWPVVTNDGQDLKLLESKRRIEKSSSSQGHFFRTSINPDVNGLRGSMSSSTSSIQNNMDRLSEIRADLKHIEQRQEDSLELKRQLKEMEIKKNNFEALYKKHDELLRSTEAKLEKETNEKQRLEWTSKTLNMELKNVKERLESLEEEKNSLHQRCLKLKEEKDNYDEKLRALQNASIQTATTTLLREEDIEKIKSRHREELKLLSAENDELHQRTKQLQSDLQLHKESLDVTIRYKIDLEKALEEKAFLQMELDRLKHDRDAIEQEKSEYKTKYDALQEEIRTILSDRTKVEQKLTNELQEQIKQRQRTSDDVKKYKTQIEQLNMKLGDAEARLLVLQTQNEALLASKDREIKHEFESLTQRLNQIESEKLNAEQRYQNERKEILNKQQQPSMLHEPLVILTSTPLSNGVQAHQHHSPSSPCVKCDTLQRSFEQEREQRLRTEQDNDRLRDFVSRQKQQDEHQRNDQSKEMRSETERVKQELERLRHDFDRLIMNYEPNHNGQQQRAQIHSKIENMRHLHEEDYRQRHRTISGENKSSVPPMTNGYHHSTSSMKHEHHSANACSICSNTQVLKERLDSAIDLSLSEQRIKAMKQMQTLPRQRTPVTSVYLPTTYSSTDHLRKRYYS